MVLWLSHSRGLAQQEGPKEPATDSLELEIPKERAQEMSPQFKAALLSAVLPGAGQVYNKKYWKVPLVYAGVVGFGAAIQFNHERYVTFRNGLIISTDDDPSTENGFPLNTYDNNGLQRIRDAYRRNRDLSIILATAFYGLNIADAIVDAHLKDFDVGEDLSLRISPSLIPTMTEGRPAVVGLTVSVKIR